MDFPFEYIDDDNLKMKCCVPNNKCKTPATFKILRPGGKWCGEAACSEHLASVLIDVYQHQAVGE